MGKINWLIAASGAIGASLLATGGAMAETPDTLLDRLDNYQGTPSLGQVNSVSQFSDVSPRHWAYTALQSLVERYDCIEGFPDGTFRGDTSLTRYEFAAALNSCLQVVEQLVAQGGASDVTRDDLAQLFQIAQQFQDELAALGGRVDGLEGRVDEIEDNQFSTTTKLDAEVIIQADSAFGGDPVIARGDIGSDGEEIDVQEQTTVGFRVRLNFDTSFTGKDRLRTRLQADNLQFLGDTTGTQAASFNLFPLGLGPANEFFIGELSYSFPIANDKVTVVVAADGLLIDDLFNAGPTAAFAYDSLNLTVAYNNLIYDVSNADGPAIGANILLGEKAQLDIGYFVPRFVGSSPDAGIFNSSFSTGAHLNVDFSDKFSASLAYLYNFYDADQFFDVSGFVGSDNAIQPFGNEDTISNNLGFQFNYAVSPKFGFGGYVGYAFASSRAPDDDGASADLITAQVNVHFPDLGKEGGALVLSAAVPPTVIGADGTTGSGFDVLTDAEVAESLGGDGGLPVVIDLEYRYPFNDNILTTFGGVAVINPEGNSENDTVFVGTIRTQFFF